MTGPGWRVRRASVEDMEALVRLRYALFRELAPKETDDGGDALLAATHRFLRESLPTGRFCAWLGERDGGEAVSCSGLALVDRPPSPGAISAQEGYVFNMYTAPAWRGKGLGRAMMEALVAHARELRLQKLTLHTSADGRPLYESLGFAPHPDALEWAG